MENPLLPTPPVESPYLVHFLVGVVVLLVAAIIFFARFAIGKTTEYIGKIEAERKQAVDDSKAERDKAEAKLEADRIANSKRWEDSEGRRQKGREDLQNLVRDTTAELANDIKQSSGILDAKIEAQGKSVVDLLLRVQRLEDWQKSQSHNQK